MSHSASPTKATARPAKVISLIAMTRLPLVALAASAILASGSAALAQQPASEPQQDPTWVLSSGTSLTFFPSGDVYRVYVADPHRPTNALVESSIFDNTIPEVGSPVTRLAAGGRFGMLRIGPAKPGGRAWQVSIEAGFDAVFDSKNRLDAVGWDGNYGLTLTTASSSRVALKIAVLHVSAHLGDEFQDRTGRERINYTREEVAVGVAWQWSPRWRLYGETGGAYRMGHPSLDTWRAQSGIEFDSGRGPCGQKFACYAAVDVSTFEERKWRVDLTANVGIVIHGPGRTTRLFVEWHDGRPTPNEFFLDSLSSLSVGLKIDL